MFDFIDDCIIKFDGVLRNLWPTWPTQTQEENPADAYLPVHLSYLEKHQVAGMMRVNLAGEVAAQGLYRGQMLLAREPELKAHLHKAAQEEFAHYAWCCQRLCELDARPSVFNPLWYCGAVMIGLMASVMSDAKSLGFVIATEEQVSKHLAGHLERLPSDDLQSRAIVAKMYQDELEHAQDAAQRGGERLSLPIQQMMHWVAQIMIQTSSLM